MKVVAKRKIKYPMGLERAYAKEIVAHVKSLMAIVRSFEPKMRNVLSSMSIAFDADDPEEEYEPEDELSELMMEIAAAVAVMSSMRPQVERMYDLVYKHAYSEISAVFDSVFGTKPIAISNTIKTTGSGAGTAFTSIKVPTTVKVPTPIKVPTTGSGAGTAFNAARGETLVKRLTQEEQLEQLKRIWVQENLDLIKSIDAETLRKIRETMSDMIIGTIDKAKLTKTLQEQLEKIAHVETNRAALIGRDQVGKLNGRIAEYLQRQAGIEEYEWSTEGDERVRPAHKVRDGLVFRWAEPPPDGHPGQPIQCRCIADPIIDIDKIAMNPKRGSYTALDYEEEDKTRIEVELKDFGKAYIPKAKITRYALNPLQEVHKARAFQTYLGYNLSNADELIQNVLENIGQYEAVKKQDPKGYGERLTVTMMLKGPNGKEEPVRTGWIIDKEKDEIRMTSIYVNRRKKGKSQRKAKKKKG